MQHPYHGQRGIRVICLLAYVAQDKAQWTFQQGREGALRGARAAKAQEKKAQEKKSRKSAMAASRRTC
ncbi:hypothetical protein C4K68_25670 [Pokkaliibacter plantistimulans]|uniref:Uncharacterized protein n=1 Tax=Proteobacteria bacterium 228 TaxID=2083153 RepID=A0A2S5KHU9_9PROT|nr:hypothetical protein C4K68_25670 [Pokkaliibacter plantistimulans]